MNTRGATHAWRRVSRVVTQCLVGSSVYTGVAATQIVGARNLATARCNATGYQPYSLIGSTTISADSKVLRFGLPEGESLGLELPSCLKVKQSFAAADGNEDIVLDKSYSPISLPDATGFFELLVKGYAPRPAGHSPIHGAPGGLGAFLVGMQLGDVAVMDKKKPRKFHNAPYSPNRWADLGLVAGGTGIAPLLQMIRSVLADPQDHTRLSLVFANRLDEDILMRAELDALAAAHPERMRIHYVLSSPPEGWTGGRGWVSEEDVSAPHLPAPADSTMVLVCGRDEFLDTVSGRTARAAPPPGKQKGPKVQGELTGVLAAVGYQAKHVYKF
jgi:cytochrome-b5 reductase